MECQCKELSTLTLTAPLRCHTSKYSQLLHCHHDVREEWLEKVIDLIGDQSDELNESHSNEGVGSCSLVPSCCVCVEFGQTKHSKVDEKGNFKY